MATAAGRELGCSLTKRLMAAEEHVLAGLDEPRERETFRALLQRLAIRANDLDPVYNACEMAKLALPSQGE